MIEQQVAHGTVEIGLTDHVTAELRRLEGDYKATMARIDRMRADAKVGADTSDLDRKLLIAKDQLRRLRGERATVTLEAEKKAFDVAIAAARREIAILDGKKATIQIETRGAQVAMAQLAAVRREEAARANAQAAYAKQTKLVIAEDAKRELQIARLRQQYSKLTDDIEAANAEAKKFKGPEMRAKLNVDRSVLVAQMKVVKAELDRIGGTPPVRIRVDNNYDDVRSGFKRMLLGLRDDAKHGGTAILGAIGRIGDIRVFGTKLGTLVPIIGTLAPLITSLIGSAGALVGVLGTGLTGAATIAGGALSGLALNLGGVLAATGQIRDDLKNVNAAYDAYDKTIKTYGANSKQGILAQEKLNSLLQSVDPLAAQAGKGIHALGNRFQDLTNVATHRDFGAILTGGFKALNKLLPTFANNTNKTMDILRAKVTTFEKALSSPAGVKIFDSLGKSANKFLGPVLTGFTHIAAAMAHIFESGARLFAGPVGNGFRKWAKDLDLATQPGAKLDDQIRRLGQHAGDLLHLFGAFGRLLVTVFNGGANAGDGLVKSLTGVFDRWNAFLKTTRGQKDLADFFRRSADNTKALFAALAPVVAAFGQWSNLLTPFTTGLLQGLTFVTGLVAGFVRLVGLGGPLGALGATIGAAFAVSKIGTFVAFLIRAVALMKELGAVGSVRAIATGQFSGLLAGAKAAATELELAMIAGGRAAGAEIAAAMAGGGVGGAISRGTQFAPLVGPGKTLGPLAGELPQGVAAGAAGTKLLSSGAIVPAGEASLLSKLGVILKGVLTRGAVAGAVLYGANAITPSGTGGPYNLPKPGGVALAERGFHKQVGQLNPFGSSFDPVGFFSRNNTIPSSSEDKLVAFGERVSALKKNLDQLTPGKLREIQNEAIALGNDQSLSKWRPQLEQIAKDFDPLGVAMNKVKAQFADMASYAGKHLHDILLASQVNIVQIRNTLGQGSTEARVAVAKNFQIVAADIQASMDAGVISTQHGTQLILQALSKALQSILGSSAPDAKLLGTLQNPGAYVNNVITGNTAPLLNRPGAHAQGGLVQIGRPGQAGTDKIPMSIGGTDIVVGAGEQAAIFNRHQQRVANRYLAPIGGLDGLFNKVKTPHYMAQGGPVLTGKVSWFGGPGDPSDSGHTASGIPESQPGIAVYNQSTLGGYWRVTAPNGRTNVEQQTDIGPAPWTGRVIDFLYSALGQFGYNTSNFPTDGIGSAVYLGKGAGAAAVGAGGPTPTSVAHIARAVVKLKGAIGQVAQAGLDKVRAAANARIDAAQIAAGSLGSLSGGGLSGMLPLSAAGTSGALAAMISKANEIASHNYPYLWGGGHNPGFTPPYDCSGAVSAVLHAGGLLGSPEVSGDFMHYGLPGAGQAISLWASPTHTFMQILGRYFGTSGGNPGGGANWISGFPGAIGPERHPAGFALGGILGKRRKGLPRHVRPQDIIPFGNGDYLLPGMAVGGLMAVTKRRGQSGYHSRPTLLVGEEGKGEYVIATNPAYRSQNEQYLARAAGSMGYNLEPVQPAATGQTPQQAFINRPASQTVGYKPPKPKKPPKPNTSGFAYGRQGSGGNTGPTNQLPILNTTTTVSDYVAQREQDAVAAYNAVAKQIDADSKQLVTLNNQYKLTKAGPHGAASRQTLDIKMKRLRDDRAKLSKRVKSLKAEADAASRDVQGQLDDKQKVDIYTNRMNADATYYNKSGDPGKLADWNAAKKQRDHYLALLKDILVRARRHAPAAYRLGLDDQISSAENDIASATTESAPSGPGSGGLDTFLASFGGDKTLTSLTEAFALAQVNDVPDNPLTPNVNENIPSLADNLQVAGQLKDFYASTLNRAQVTGQAPAVITDAANAYVSARDQYQSIADTITGAQAAQVQQGISNAQNYGTARDDLYKSFGSNFAPVWTQPGVPQSPAAVGTVGAFGPNEGGAASGPTQVNVTNYFPTPPPDPHAFSTGLAWELRAAV